MKCMIAHTSALIKLMRYYYWLKLIHKKRKLWYQTSKTEAPKKCEERYCKSLFNFVCDINVDYFERYHINARSTEQIKHPLFIRITIVVWFVRVHFLIGNAPIYKLFYSTAFCCHCFWSPFYIEQYLREQTSTTE